MDSLSATTQRVDRPGARFGPGAVAMFAFLAACGLVTLIAEGDIADAAGAVGVLVGSATTGSLFVRRARLLDGRERFGWSLIGIGLLVAALGVLVVAAMFFVTGAAPAFGMTDLFFFASYVAILSGFGALPHTQGSRLQRTRMVMDGMVGAVFVGALLWVYLLPNLMQGLETAPMATRVIGSIYPFLDLLILTTAILVLLRRSAYRFDSRVALFTVGLVAQVFGDVAFLASASSGSFEDAEPLYVMNLTALAAFFAAAYLLKATPAVREYAERNPPLWTLVAPYLPAMGMLVFLVMDTYRSPDEKTDTVLLAATILVGLLVIARQGVAIVENRRSIEGHRNVLVSTISHELRTPLAAIAGFVDLLREDDDSVSHAEQEEMLEIIHQQTGYMSRIVSDLIMLARDSGNDIHVEAREVPMIDLAMTSIRASGVPEQSVTVDCSPKLTGFVDSDRLQQVLVNLLTNASRYGGSNRLLRITARGSDLTLEVHDDGSGIPRRYEVRVWDRFERGPNRFNAAIPGSGIGLSIVAAIIAAHGGSATYRMSAELGGACFAVVLPGRGSIAGESTQGARVMKAAPTQPRGEAVKRGIAT